MKHLHQLLLVAGTIISAVLGTEVLPNNDPAVLEFLKFVKDVGAFESEGSNCAIDYRVLKYCPDICTSITTSCLKKLLDHNFMKVLTDLPGIILDCLNQIPPETFQNLLDEEEFIEDKIHMLTFSVQPYPDAPYIRHLRGRAIDYIYWPSIKNEFFEDPDNAAWIIKIDIEKLRQNPLISSRLILTFDGLKDNAFWQNPDNCRDFLFDLNLINEENLQFITYNCFRALRTSVKLMLDADKVAKLNSDIFTSFQLDDVPSLQPTAYQSLPEDLIAQLIKGDTKETIKWCLSIAIYLTSATKVRYESKCESILKAIQ